MCCSMYSWRLYDVLRRIRAHIVPCVSEFGWANSRRLNKVERRCLQLVKIHSARRMYILYFYHFIFWFRFFVLHFISTTGNLCLFPTFSSWSMFFSPCHFCWLCVVCGQDQLKIKIQKKKKRKCESIFVPVLDAWVEAGERISFDYLLKIIIAIYVDSKAYVHWFRV